MTTNKFGCCLKSDAGCTKRNPASLFSPIFSGSQPATSSLVGKEETATEDKRRRLRRLVLSWPFLTRRRRHNQAADFRDVPSGTGRFCPAIGGQPGFPLRLLVQSRPTLSASDLQLIALIRIDDRRILILKHARDLVPVFHMHVPMDQIARLVFFQQRQK